MWYKFYWCPVFDNFIINLTKVHNAGANFIEINNIVQYFEVGNCNLNLDNLGTCVNHKAIDLISI